MKYLLMSTVTLVAGLSLALIPRAQKSCHDVGFKLEHTLLPFTSAPKDLRIDFEQTCDLTHTVAVRHGLETLVSKQLDDCFTALEADLVTVEALEKQCAIGGFSISVRLQSSSLLAHPIS